VCDRDCLLSVGWDEKDDQFGVSVRAVDEKGFAATSFCAFATLKSGFAAADLHAALVAKLDERFPRWRKRMMLRAEN